MRTKGELESKDITRVFNFWQTKLNLDHWRIKWILCKSDHIKEYPKALMLVRPTRTRNLAEITITKRTLGLNCYDFQKLAVHELIHLIFDPLAEEHTFELQYPTPHKREKEYKDRFTRDLERAVEHTAHVVFDLSPGLACFCENCNLNDNNGLR